MAAVLNTVGWFSPCSDQITSLTCVVSLLLCCNSNGALAWSLNGFFRLSISHYPLVQPRLPLARVAHIITILTCRLGYALLGSLTPALWLVRLIWRKCRSSTPSSDVLFGSSLRVLICTYSKLVSLAKRQG